MPEEIHKQYTMGGRAEKAKLLQMFIDSGLDKALDSRQKPFQIWTSKLRFESLGTRVVVHASIACFSSISLGSPCDFAAPSPGEVPTACADG